MSFDVFNHLEPGDGPSEWDGRSPIELISALSKLYPRCLDDDLHSVVLYFDGNAWCVESTRGDMTVHAEASALFDDESNSFGEFEPASNEYPEALLSALLDSCRLRNVQKYLQVFAPDMFSMLSLVQTDAATAAEADTRAYDEKRARVFQEIAVVTSEGLAQKIDLVPGCISALKRMQSLDTLGAKDASRWDDLRSANWQHGNMQELVLTDLRSLVWEEFEALPRAEQAALWFREIAAGYRSVKSPLEWDFGSEDWSKSFRAYGLDEYIELVAKKILWAARDESERSR